MFFSPGRFCDKLVSAILANAETEGTSGKVVSTFLIKMQVVIARLAASSVREMVRLGQDVWFDGNEAAAEKNKTPGNDAEGWSSFGSARLRARVTSTEICPKLPLQRRCSADRSRRKPSRVLPGTSPSRAARNGTSRY